MLQYYICNKCSDTFVWDSFQHDKNAPIICPHCKSGVPLPDKIESRVSRLINSSNIKQDGLDSLGNKLNAAGARAEIGIQNGQQYKSNVNYIPPDAFKDGLHSGEIKFVPAPYYPNPIQDISALKILDQTKFTETLAAILAELQKSNHHLENVIRALAAKEPDLR